MSGEHYAFQERGHNVDLEVDVVVVGSGAGGATAAVTLARHGLKVAVVESGAWRDPEHLPSTAYGGMRDLMPAFGASVTMGRAQWPLVQGKAVGGTTVINSAICVRTPEDVLATWAARGLGDLREPIGRYQDQLESELSVQSDGELLGKHNELALAGAQARGYVSHLTNRYVNNCAGSGQCLQGCRKGRKQSLNLNFIPEAVERGGVVLSCAPVSRIRLRGLRAVGVEGRFVHPRTRRKGARFTVRARKAVFVAASATGSPVLLRASGLRHKALGKHFLAHPGGSIFAVYDEPVDQNIGQTQGWASTAFRLDRGYKLETLALPPDLVSSRIKGGGTELCKRLEDYRYMTMWVFVTRARTEGSVHRGPFGPMVRYELDEHDMRMFRSGAHELAMTHFAAGAKYVLAGIHGLPYAIGPDEVHLLQDAPLDPRAWVGVLSHLFGGCTMGTDPSSTVCDSQGRVHGIDGLVIADASQIPTTLGVNPQHTIMALARLRADQLVGAA